MSRDMTSQDLLIDLQVTLKAIENNVHEAYRGANKDCYDISQEMDDDDPILDKMEFRADCVRHAVYHIGCALQRVEAAIYSFEPLDEEELEEAAFSRKFSI